MLSGYRRARAQLKSQAYAQAAAGTPTGPVDPGRPPAGASHRFDGVATELTASTRAVKMAVLFGFLGMLSAVLTAAVTWVVWDDVARGLGMAPPLAQKPASVGHAVLLLLAISPCLLMTAAGAAWSAMYSIGQVRVRLAGDVLEVFTGVGPVGWRRRLSAADITAVREDIRVKHGESGAVTIKRIALDRVTGRPVLFGSALSEERRWWVRGVLASLLGR